MSLSEIAKNTKLFQAQVFIALLFGDFELAKSGIFTLVRPRLGLASNFGRICTGKIAI